MAVGVSDAADFRLHFYNADGSRGEMCGNGARCICRFAYDMGIAPAVMTVQTDAGLVPGWRLDENQYRVKLNNPSVLDLSRKYLTALFPVSLSTPPIRRHIVKPQAPKFTRTPTARSISSLRVSERVVQSRALESI